MLQVVHKTFGVNLVNMRGECRSFARLGRRIGKTRKNEAKSDDERDYCLHFYFALLCCWLWFGASLTSGLSGAGPRASECKHDAPSRVHSRPLVMRPFSQRPHWSPPPFLMA